jgi:response regulator RpfG family c-di-GMP phosphodiesterase
MLPAGEPFSKVVRQQRATAPRQELADRFVAQTSHWVNRLSHLFDRLKNGDNVEFRITEGISSDALAQAVADFDLFATLGANPPVGEYPSRHSLHVAMLAMALGTTMGYDRQALLDLGVGCLIHDIGMTVNPKAYQHGKSLSRDNVFTIVDHPVIVLDLIQPHMERIPPASRIVAYQMHERCDGSGYPRGYKGSRIHPLAKIAAVADVFVALVSPRPHRGPLVPYFAMDTILRDATKGVYDPAVVRALLNTVSIFPLGSFVALNDRREARVLRARGAAYHKPVVEVWNAGSLTTEVIDLSEHRDLKVVRALAVPSHWPTEAGVVRAVDRGRRKANAISRSGLNYQRCKL